VLLMHLLKWQAQPGNCGRSCLLAIREQRRQIARSLKQNPSLRPQLAEILADAYGDAVLSAAREMDCDEDSLPSASPWTFDQAMEGEPVSDHGA
jgi:hypothetical protein